MNRKDKKTRRKLATKPNAAKTPLEEFDFNSAIVVYSDAPETNPDGLRDYCSRTHFRKSVEELALAIDEIHASLWRALRKTAGKANLTNAEFETSIRNCLKKHHGEVNELGTIALLNFAHWGACHEGLFHYDPNTWNAELPWNLPNELTG